MTTNIIEYDELNPIDTLMGEGVTKVIKDKERNKLKETKHQNSILNMQTRGIIT